MEPREKQKPYCVINRTASHKQSPTQTRCSPAQGGAIVLSSAREERSLQLREAFGQAGLALQKQNQLQLWSEELWVLLTKGEHFRKEVAGILQMSFIALAFLQKACFSEYTYTLINLMITLYTQTQTFFHCPHSDYRYLQNSLWTSIKKNQLLPQSAGVSRVWVSFCS